MSETVHGAQVAGSGGRRGWRLRRLGAMLCLAALLGVFGRLPAEEPATRPAAEGDLRQKIARAIRDLGSDSWRVREAATKRLWSIGRPAEPALREAAKGSDMEVRVRAESILAKFRHGIYPDTPEDVRALIERYRSGSPDVQRIVVRELLARGRPGIRAVVALADAQPDPKLREAVFGQLDRYAAKVVPTLLADGDFAKAEGILTAAAAGGRPPAIRNFAAYHLIRGGLKKQIDRCLAKPHSDSAPAWKRLAYLHRANGDLAAAAAAAEKSGDQPLLKSILYERGDWKRLSDLQPWDAELAGGIEQLGYMAAYARLAGQTKRFERAVGAIRTLEDGKDKRWFRVEALLLNDRPADAGALLTKMKMHRPAFELQRAQVHFGAAVALVQKLKHERPKELPALEIEAVRLLTALGQPKAAEKMAERLLNLAAESPHTGNLLNRIRVERALGRMDKALDRCAYELDRRYENSSSLPPLEAAFPYAGIPLGEWWTYLRQENPHETFRRSLERLRELAEGKTPRKQLAAWAADLTDSDDVPVKERRRMLEALADVCRRDGHDEMALKLYRACAEGKSSASAHERIADLLAKQEKWAEAAEQYRKARKAERGRQYHAFLAGRALLRAGKADEGRKLMDLATLAPLGDEGARYRLAEQLERRGLQAEADRQWTILLRTGEFDSYELGECSRHAAYRQALAAGKFFAAADHCERGRLPCLKASTGMVSVAGYLYLAARIHLARARGHLAAGDADKAAAFANRALAALPGNVDIPIALCHPLAKLGATDQADKLFAAVYDHLAAVCRQYPRSAGRCNQIAWLAARCRRRLDDGLRLAERAVRLKPDTPAYIDTLAEIHFQRGSRAQALRLMKRCVELDAKNAYFRRQLKRFQTGDPSTDPEEP